MRLTTRPYSAVSFAHGGRPAFTFVELLLVVVIVGMLAGVTVPRYAQTIARQSLEAAARRIKADLALAQRQAKFSSGTITVDFNISNSRYRLQNVPDPNHPTKDYRVELSQEPYRTTIVSANFGGSTDVTFDAYGVPDNNGTVVIQVGPYQKTITVDINGIR